MQSLKLFITYAVIMLIIMVITPTAITAQSLIVCGIVPLPDDNIVTSPSGRYIMVQNLFNTFNTIYTGGNIQSITVWDRTTCKHNTNPIDGAEFFGWSPNERYMALGKMHRGPSMGSYCTFLYIFSTDLMTSLFDTPYCKSPGEGGIYPVRWEADNRLVIQVSASGLTTAMPQQGFYIYDPSTAKSEYIGLNLPPKNTHNIPANVKAVTSFNRLHHIAIINSPDATTITIWSESVPLYDQEFHTPGNFTEFLMWSNDSRFAVMLSKDSRVSKIIVFDAVVGAWLPFPQICQGNQTTTCNEGKPLSISPASDTLLTSTGWLINLNSLSYTQIPIANELEKVSWSPDETYLLTEWLPSKANVYCGQFAIWTTDDIHLRYFHISSSCGEHISPDYVITEWRGTQTLDLDTFSTRWIQVQLAVYIWSEDGLYLIDPATGKMTKAEDMKG